MAITLDLLEKLVISEVENLHIRIDELSKNYENIIQRLETLERQMSIVFVSIDELRTEVKYLKDNMVTKKEVYEIIQDAIEAIIPQAIDSAMEAALKKYLPNQAA